MVVGGEEHVALDGLQAVVQGGDGLQIQVVGGLVKQQHVGPGEHHPGEHAPHLLAAGEHLDGLVNLVAGEEHPAQETPQIGLVVRIWNRAVWAFSLSPTKAILSPWPTMKLTLSSTFTPSMVLLTSVTKRMSLPTSRSGEKATQG